VTTRHIFAALTCGLLLPVPAPAQQSAPGRSDPVERFSGISFVDPKVHAETYEHIEIFRRLLARKLQEFAPTQAVDVGANPRYLTTFLNDLNVNQAANKPMGANAFFPNWQLAGNRLTQVGVSPEVAVEGVYLKGRGGVVFTVTLPTSARKGKTEAERPARKPVSDWERVQAEVRGEKQSEEKPAPPTRRSLQEVIAKVLADNGHRLAHLDGQEVVTVVVTFRDPPPAVGAAASTDTLFNLAFVNQPQPNYPALNEANFLFNNALAQQHVIAPATAEPKKEPPAATKDQILLGDLNARQGKHEEALSAYTRAAELLANDGNPSAKEELYKKLAQAYLAKGDVERAGKALESYRRVRQSAAGDNKEKSKQADKPALAGKLILAAPKALLDKAGKEGLRFEEFFQSLTIQDLHFGDSK
jgi:tetratricopeptide (TPR) repeat protein